MGAEQSVPEQPDGIESESFDLPTPWDAANRVEEFLTWWGDGRIEPAVDSPEVLAVPPLFARDLQALINAQRAKADLSDHRLPAAEATLDHAEDRIADLLDDYGFARPDGLAEALGMLSTAFQVGAWLHEAALNPAALYSGVLVGVGGEHDTPPNDEQCNRAAGMIERAIRRAMGPYYVSQAEARLVRAIGEGDVCACAVDYSTLDHARWTPPQCTVHPDGGAQ